MKGNILHYTEEMHERYLSGEKVKDISIRTGLSEGCLYKRFQRFRKTQQQMITQVGTRNEDAQKIKSAEQTVLQSEGFDWEENILAGILSFVTVFLSVFFIPKI